MSPIAIRRLGRRRHQLALIWVILVFGAVIAVHHSAISMAHNDHGTALGAVVEMCLGVCAAVVAVAVGIVALGPRRPAVMFAPVVPAPVRTPAPRGRDGPGLLVVLCVCRR
ncbi:MAG: hypothetical protein M3296_00055 [Actinomycetota bacterium]|nr:hypothetical protein [Actinomycetota bacterium]